MGPYDGLIVCGRCSSKSAAGFAYELIWAKWLLYLGYIQGTTQETLWGCQEETAALSKAEGNLTGTPTLSIGYSSGFRVAPAAELGLLSEVYQRSKKREHPIFCWVICCSWVMGLCCFPLCVCGPLGFCCKSYSYNLCTWNVHRVHLVAVWCTICFNYSIVYVYYF